ncbi:hypothetical protein CR513_06347, partial [Mucuna pruriens]
MKQPKISQGMIKALRKKLVEAMPKLIIYECLLMYLTNSPRLYNLLTTAAKLGPSIECPTPYEISKVCLEDEYKIMQSWINELKPTWKESGVTIMCDGWTNSINHMHIMNFFVYCSKGMVILKSIDASNVASKNVDYYLKLLDKVMEKVREEYVIQVVIDNETTLKFSSLKLMKKSLSLLVFIWICAWKILRKDLHLKPKRLLRAKSFGIKAINIIKAFVPIVKVLKLLDGDEISNQR